MDKKKAAFRVGVLTFIGLLVLTLIEYWVSFMAAATIPLFIIALLKAGLILEFFMHISSLWSEEGH